MPRALNPIVVLPLPSFAFAVRVLGSPDRRRSLRASASPVAAPDAKRQEPPAHATFHLLRKHVSKHEGAHAFAGFDEVRDDLEAGCRRRAEAALDSLRDTTGLA